MRPRAAWFVLFAFSGIAAFAFLAMAPATQPPGPPSATPSPAVTGPVSASPPPAGLMILDVLVSPAPLRAGKPVSVMVHTTPDVMSMQARVLAFRVLIPKTGDGVFSGSMTVPWWARFYHGTFHVTFIGSDASGAQTRMAETVRI